MIHRIFRLTFMLWTATMLSLAAQQAPNGYILDENLLLDDERKATLVKTLKAAEEQGHKVYAAFFSSLPDDELTGNRAASLAKTWLGNEMGAVLVYNQEENRLAVAPSPGFRLLQTSRQLPDVVQRAERSLAQGRPVPMVLREAVLDLEYEVRMARMEHGAAERQSWLFVAGGAMLGLMIAGGIFLFGLNYLRHHNLFDHAYEFPEPSRPTRLGGPFSGGHSAVLENKRG